MHDVVVLFRISIIGYLRPGNSLRTEIWDRDAAQLVESLLYEGVWEIPG